MIYNHIVQDIKNQNKKTHNHKINKQVQNYIFALVHEDQKPKEAKMALQVFDSYLVIIDLCSDPY